MSEDETEQPTDDSPPPPGTDQDGDTGSWTAENTEPERSPDPAADDDETPPPAARRRRRLGRVTARVVVALLSVVAMVLSGYAYTVVSTLRDGTHGDDRITGLDRDEAPDPPDEDRAIDILLVGTDARTDMQGNPLPQEMLRTLRTERSPGINTDTLIVLRVPRDGGAPTAVSVPRDTWLRTPSGEPGKVNAVYGRAKTRKARELRRQGVTDAGEVARASDEAGRTALIKTVQRFTQVHIDHYAEVNLLGFYLLTKALGGVTVCLRQPTHDPDSGAHFRAGVQQLSAAEALSFVRQRKNLPGGKARIKRQQAFLSAALHRVLSAGTLTDTARLRDLADTVRRSFVLDQDLDLLEFAQRVKGIATGDVSFVTIPVVTINGRSPDGLSIVEVDRARVRDFMDGLVDSPDTTTPPPDESTGGGGSPMGEHLARGQPDGVPCVY